MTDSVSFLPVFGTKPKKIIGRSEIIDAFAEGLTLPIGHRQRATLLLGQSGTGKTALLLELAEMAEKNNYVTARVTASEYMLVEIIQTIQFNGARFVKTPKSRTRGSSSGEKRFSTGLTFTKVTEEQFGFRVKLELLCDELAKYRKGILILIDDVQSNTPEVKSLAYAYQHLVGDNKNVALLMAGQPGAISAVLTDETLAFLNRAYKVQLEPLSSGDISVYYATEFKKQGKSISSQVMETAVSATKGYPYLIQLIGFFILRFAEDVDVITDEIVEQAIDSSKKEMIDSVFAAALNPLSQGDMNFLCAMAVDFSDSRIRDIEKRLSVSQSYAQTYRTRLIRAGIIEPIKRGELRIVIPFLNEYLRGDF